MNTIDDSGAHETGSVIVTGAVAVPLVQSILSYQRSMARGDFAAARAIFDPAVEYFVPGHNALSGTYRGAAAVMGYFQRLMQITSGTYAISGMTWLVCHERILLETRNTARIGEKRLMWEEAVLFEFRNGLKYRIHLFQADQTAVDAFIGP